MPIIIALFLTDLSGIIWFALIPAIILIAKVHGYSTKSAGKDTPLHHFNMVKTLMDWMKDKDIIKEDLNNLKKCVANRGKEGHCPKS